MNVKLSVSCCSRILYSLTENEFLSRNTNGFVKSIGTMLNANSLYMYSVDIECLYPNIPISETIDIILNRLFTEVSSNFNAFSLWQFRTILDLCFENAYIKFNNKVHQQFVGLARGRPALPVAANIFLIISNRRF